GLSNEFFDGVAPPVAVRRTRSDVDYHLFDPECGRQFVACRYDRFRTVFVLDCCQYRHTIMERSESINDLARNCRYGKCSVEDARDGYSPIDARQSITASRTRRAVASARRPSRANTMINTLSAVRS